METAKRNLVILYVEWLYILLKYILTSVAGLGTLLLNSLVVTLNSTFMLHCGTCNFGFKVGAAFVSMSD